MKTPILPRLPAGTGPLPSANLPLLTSFAFCQEEVKGSWRRGVGAINLVPTCASGVVCGHHWWALSHPTLLGQPRSPFTLWGGWVKA